MNKDTKSNHPSPSEDSLLQSKIRRPYGCEGSIPSGGTIKNIKKAKNFLTNMLIFEII